MAIAKHPERNQEKKPWAESTAGATWKAAGHKHMVWGKQSDGTDFDMKAYHDKKSAERSGKGKQERTLLNTLASTINF